MLKALKIIGASLLWTVIGVLALVGSAALHIRVSASRKFVTEIAESAVGENVRGRLEIGEIEELSLRHVVVTNVHIFDPAGRDVIQASRVEARINPSALAHGLIHVPYVLITGARVVLVKGAEHTPTFLEAFEPKVVSTTPSSSVVHVLIDRVDVRNAVAEGDVEGVDGIRAHAVNARVRAEFQDALLLTVQDANLVVDEPYESPVNVSRVTGTIDTTEGEGVRLHVVATTGAADRFRANVRVIPAHAPDNGPGTEIDILAHAEPISVETLRGAHIEGLERVRGTATGYAHMFGHVEDLTYDAYLHHEGGDALVHGTISEARGIDVEVTTRSFLVDHAVEGAPPGLDVGGLARLHVTPADANSPPTFHGELRAFAYGRWAIPALTVDGAFEPEAIRIDRVDAPYANGHVSGHGRIATSEDGTVDLDVNARIPQIAIDPNIHSLVPNARGSLNASVHIHTASRDAGDPVVDVSGSASLGNLRYGEIVAASVHTRGRLRVSGRTPTVNATVQASQLRIASFNIGSGTVAVRGGPSRYTTSGRFTSAEQESASFDAVVEIDRQEAIHIDAERFELAIGANVWRGAIAGMVIRPGRYIDAEMVRLASGSQRLEARGRVAFNSDQNLDVVLQDFDISAVRPFLAEDAPRLLGRVDAHVVLTGNLAQPTVALDGAYREGCIDRIDAIESVFRVTYEAGDLDIDQQIDLGDRGTLALNGEGRLDASIPNPIEALRGGQYALTLEATALNTDTFAAYLPEDYEGFGGLVDGRVAFSGSIAHPALLTDIVFSSRPFLGVPPVSLTIASTFNESDFGGALIFRDGDHVLLQLDARYEGDARLLFSSKEKLFRSLRTNIWRVHLNVPQQSTQDWSPALRLIARGAPVEGGMWLVAQGGPRGFGAELSARGKWNGDLSRYPCGENSTPTASLTATVSHGEVRAEVHGALKQNEEAFSLIATTRADVDEWLASMELPTAPPATTVDVNIPEMELGEVPFICTRFTGPIRGSAHISELFTPRHSARVMLNAQGLQANDGASTDIDLVANVSTRALVADVSLQGETGDSNAEVQATAQIDWPSAMPYPVVHPDARFLLLAQFNQVQVAPLLALVPGISDAAAMFDGMLQAQGTRDELEWNGAIDVREGTFELVGPGQRLDEVAGRIEFGEQHARIVSLHGVDVDGSIDASGELQFHGVIPHAAELNVTLGRFPVRRDGLVLATLTGRAGLRATVTTEQTDIQVDVRDLTVRLPDQSDQTVQGLEPNPDITVVGETREAEVAQAAYPFHVLIDASQPFWVRRSDFAAQVSVNLDVTYRDPTLRVGGFVNLRRGFFEIFGKRFDLARGSLVFDDSTDLDPDLDIVAVYTLPGGQSRSVTVTVSGRLSSPHIEFSTTEATTDRGEIIALLISGRTSLSSGTSGASTVDAQQQAASFVSGVLAGVLTLGLRRQLGDLFPIISIESGNTAFTSARVRVGFQAESFIRDNLPSLSNFIQGAYFEGFAAVSSADQSNTTVTQAQGASPYGGLIELRFPSSFVFTGTVRYPGSYGADLTWEP